MKESYPKEMVASFKILPSLIRNHTAIPFGEQVCYTLGIHPEDKALLESNLSAEVDEQTDGQGTQTLPFLFCPSGAP